MKKILSVILAVSLLCGAALTAAAYDTGDANHDGKVKANDARLVLRYAAGLEKAENLDLSLVDVTADGNVKANDARLILRAAAGLESLGESADPDKAAAVKIYADAVAKVKNGGVSYNKKEWQNISDLNITGNGMIDDTIAGIVGSYITTEETAEEQFSSEEDAVRRFPGWDVTDLACVASATCTMNENGNYNIEIKSCTDDNPLKKGSDIGKFTNSYLAWDGVEAELKDIDAIKEYSDVHLIETVTISAEITPDGNFVSLGHSVSCDIKIGHAKILFVKLENKSAHFDDFAQYTGFTY